MDQVAWEVKHVHAVDVEGHSQGTTKIASGAHNHKHGVVKVALVEESELGGVSLNHCGQFTSLWVEGQTTAAVRWSSISEGVTSGDLQEPVNASSIFNAEDVGFFWNFSIKDVSRCLVVFTTAKEETLVGHLSDCIDAGHDVETCVPSELSISLLQAHNAADTAVFASHVEGLLVSQVREQVLRNLASQKFGGCGDLVVGELEIPLNFWVFDVAALLACVVKLFHVEFDELHLVGHQEGRVDVRFTVPVVRIVKEDALVSLVKGDIGGLALERVERIDSSICRVDSEHHWLRESCSQHNHLGVVRGHLTASDIVDRTGVVVEATPFVVAFQVHGIQETVLSSCWSEIVRHRSPSHDKEIVDGVVDHAGSFFVGETARCYRKRVLQTPLGLLG